MTKTLAYWIFAGIVAVSLVGCGKGVDRKLDFSGTEKQLGESYGEAMMGANPDQQNVLRERMMEVLTSVISLGKKSNPALVEANAAKKNSDDFQRVKNMTVKEIFNWHFGPERESLSNAIPVLEKFSSGEFLKIEKIEIQSLTPKKASRTPPNFDIKGVLWVRNDSNNFDYDFRGCEMYLAIDGRRIEKSGGDGRCENKFFTVKAGGEKVSVNFNYSVFGKDDVQNFFDFLNDPEKKKTSTWNFDSSQDSYIKSSSDSRLVYGAKKADLEDLKTRLAKISADLSTLNK